MFRQKNILIFENFNLTSLDMYNDQVYIIEPKGRIHYYRKGYDTTAPQKSMFKTRTATGSQVHR